MTRKQDQTVSLPPEMIALDVDTLLADPPPWHRIQPLPDRMVLAPQEVSSIE